MREGVEGVGDVIDRDDVRRAQLGRGHPQHPGQRAERGDRRHQVVGAVDLVHLAGARVPDNDGGPVHPPRHRRLLADDLLGCELGLVVRVGEALPEVEVVLAEAALVLTGDGHRRHMVQPARAEPPGQLDDAAGALDVGGAVLLVVGGHVVDRREVQHVLDPGEVVEDGGVEPEIVRGQVADDGNELLVADQVAAAPAQLVPRPGADQRVHRLALVAGQ